MIPLCLDQGIGVIPWSPLARGFLAGTRTREKTGETLRSRSDEFAHRMYYSDDDFKVLERVKELAAQKGCSPAQVALSWMLHKPGITSPIIGATRLAQLEEAIAALEIALETGQVSFLEEAYRPHPVLGH